MADRDDDAAPPYRYDTLATLRVLFRVGSDPVALLAPRFRFLLFALLRVRSSLAASRADDKPRESR